MIIRDRVNYSNNKVHYNFYRNKSKWRGDNSRQENLTGQIMKFFLLIQVKEQEETLTI